jgi:hypothetical protein
MGYLIDPPEHVEGAYVAVFAQTDLGDSTAIDFLRSNGIDAKPFPKMGDLAFDTLGPGSGGSIFGGETLVCVPGQDAAAALDLLADEYDLWEDEGSH